MAEIGGTVAKGYEITKDRPYTADTLNVLMSCTKGASAIWPQFLRSADCWMSRRPLPGTACVIPICISSTACQDCRFEQQRYVPA